MSPPESLGWLLREGQQLGAPRGWGPTASVGFAPFPATGIMMSQPKASLGSSDALGSVVLGRYQIAA